MPQPVKTSLIAIFAVPAMFFTLCAVAQSGANAEMYARAHAADSHAGARKPVAILAGRVIYEDELLPRMEEQLQRLRNEENELKSRALETLINQRLLEAAASRKGITADRLMEQEVSSKIPNPSDSEIEAFYLGQRESRSLVEVKPRLLETLRRQSWITRVRLIWTVSGGIGRRSSC